MDAMSSAMRTAHRFSAVSAQRAFPAVLTGKLEELSLCPAGGRKVVGDFFRSVKEHPTC